MAINFMSINFFFRTEVSVSNSTRTYLIFNCHTRYVFQNGKAITVKNHKEYCDVLHVKLHTP